MNFFFFSNCKCNAPYQSVKFETEPEKCKCQSSIQPTITSNTIVSHHEILKIIYEILDNKLLNGPLNVQLTNQLQKLITKLNEEKSFKCSGSNILDDLVKEHCMVENYNDGI